MSEKQSEIANESIEIKPNRPLPIVSEIDVVPHDRKMDPQEAVDALVNGNHVLVRDFYSSGLSVLNELKGYVQHRHSSKTFQGQRDFRLQFRDLSSRLLLEVVDHKLTVRKAPVIGWFEILYPELESFLLPFPQVQGLNSAWQWYEKGITIPAIRRKIHPFFGSYFPTRFDHIDLFDRWLQRYEGEKESAIDVGIGSGVLSFLMMKHRFKKVIGTDTNRNSIIGLAEDVERNKLSAKIELILGDLFADIDSKVDLVVFNPPWIPATHDLEGLDTAIYYEPELFTRFFAEASKYLKPDGRLVILFSNLAQITNTTESHPIQEEIDKGNRFTKELQLQKKVKPASTKTKRNLKRRSDERVELWVLKAVSR